MKAVNPTLHRRAGAMPATARHSDAENTLVTLVANLPACPGRPPTMDRRRVGASTT